MLHKTNIIPFWGQDPQVLFDSKHILDILPKKKNSYEGNLNSISKFIIYLGIILFLINNNTFYLFLSLLFLIIIYYTYKPSLPTKHIVNKSIHKVKYPIKQSFSKNQIQPIHTKIYNDTIFNDRGDDTTTIIEKPLGNQQEHLAKWLYLNEKN